MRKQLRALGAVAFVLQGAAYAAYPADAENTLALPAPQIELHDATWGIGKRVFQPQQAHVISATADLEKAFWACDYAATDRGVDATPVAMCAAVYEELKNVRFAGDFLALLDWWKQNKIVEHRDIAREERGGAVERVENYQ